MDVLSVKKEKHAASVLADLNPNGEKVSDHQNDRAGNSVLSEINEDQSVKKTGSD
ncbi:hypothetical protein [Aestuariivita sp.]|jgi:hypothetical protein|uniref:hypothetical protein n=1 Tax=Aestuariivita sp. TaxID=1872407 RepID=UPI00216D6AA2|nr:hypothetical protein [Aestuariivita sp.]MCE8005802.1 hypothetical protein [Aestuariivita sp.]